MLVEVIKPKVKTDKPRVAAYCRVSTDDENQFKSFFTQVEHYGNYIKNNPEWEYAGVYADEAVSGSGIENRTDFQKMLDECRKGNINKIITKSISRFARNTTDMLETIRELKALGISVYFEKEKIDTLKSEGELMLTVLSSFAQEELRNTSENIKWGIRRMFEDGRVMLDTNRFWGYDKDSDGNLIINEEEAKIVRRIFREYLDGKGCRQIANGLEADGIKTIKGRNKWYWGTILQMLRNEKYCGDVLQQKSYCSNHLTKKMIPNKGELPQYFIENNHEAIIPKEDFLKVQDMIKSKQSHYSNASTRGEDSKVRYAFTSKLKCAYCGKSLVHTKEGRNEKWEKHVWTCSNHRDRASLCPESRAIDDKLIKQIFIEAYKKTYKQTAEYSDKLFSKCVKSAAISSDAAVFYFKDEKEQKVNIPKRQMIKNE